MQVKKCTGPCKEGKARAGNHFHYFGEGFQDNNDPKRGRGVVRGFTGLIKDNPVGFFEGGGVVAVWEKGPDEIGE